MTLLLISLIACDGGGKDDTAGLVGDPTAGATVYADYCSSCHGAKGEGGTGPAMTDEVPELTDAEITDVVKNGYEDMAAINIDDQSIADVVAYLREEFGA